MTSRTNVGFAKNVVPERSFAMPTRRCGANLVGAQWRDSDVACHGLAGRQSNALTPVKVTHGERMVVFNFAFAGDGYWELNECSNYPPVDFLAPLR